jgi:hypothetical protein
MISKPFFLNLAIAIQQILQYAIGVRDHRSELDAIKKYAASADPSMPKQR